MKTFDSETVVSSFGYIVALRQRARGVCPDFLLDYLDRVEPNGDWICFDPDAETIEDWIIAGSRKYVISRTASEIAKFYKPATVCRAVADWHKSTGARI